MVEIIEIKDVWLTIGCRDNNEGRGPSYVMHVCESKETAIRLGKKKFVQGGDCPVEKGVAIRISNSRWLVPGQIEIETKDDARLREERERRESLLEKMKQQGFSEEEIAILSK
ncbi:TPA: hypothetical protein QCI33_003679 [Enterobacter roggenkampii]|nr:hypothetical protein [Enterobacter roggenkampii]HDR2524037.1 hypothetical protein [Enterobacter roggenkampii]